MANSLAPPGLCLFAAGVLGAGVALAGPSAAKPSSPPIVLAPLTLTLKAALAALRSVPIPSAFSILGSAQRNTCSV